MRKPKKVLVFTHAKSGISVDVRLSDANNIFVASIGETDFRDKDLASLKQKLNKFLDNSTQLIWIPAIYLCISPGYRNVDINIEARRFYLAEGPNNSSLKADWETNSKATLDKSKHSDISPKQLPCFPSKTSMHHNGKEGYLVYTEELWTAVGNFIQAIQTLQEFGKAAIQDKDIAELLTAAAGLIMSQWPEHIPETKKKDRENYDD